MGRPKKHRLSDEVLTVHFRAKGPFVVSHYDFNKNRAVRWRKKVYDNLEDALHDAVRFSTPTRFLLVDLASAVAA